MISQAKFLPFKYLSLQIELELVSSFYDCMCRQSPSGTRAAHSERRLITEPVVKYDVTTLDNAMDNKFTSHLLTGKSLNINCTSYVHAMQSIAGNTRPSVSLARSLLG